MNFSLTPSLEQFVRDRANSGDYNNASEVVRDAIRLLKRAEEHRALKMERLRAAIRDGDEALARGDFTDVNSDRELDEFFAEF
jgi:antitoxin ParD1/3/4